MSITTFTDINGKKLIALRKQHPGAQAFEIQISWKARKARIICGFDWMQPGPYPELDFDLNGEDDLKEVFETLQVAMLENGLLSVGDKTTWVDCDSFGQPS